MQATNAEKYVDLISKPIFLVSREDYEMVVAFYQGSSNKKQEAGDKDEDAEAKEETFEQSFVNELVKYGGIKRAVAIKTLEK